MQTKRSVVSHSEYFCDEPERFCKKNSKSDIRQIENNNHLSLTVDLLRTKVECSRIGLFLEALFSTLRKNAAINYIEVATKAI